VRDENALKEIYRILEAEGRGSAGEGVAIARVAQTRRMTPAQVGAELQLLARGGLVDLAAGGGPEVALTPVGLERAQQVLRNHRLWELYLTNEADYAPDHVHEDAEKIEHFLGAEQVAKLERKLDFPEIDPHGKPIPGAPGAAGA
jgi:manganese/zinc/iron transport system permease protein